MKYSPCFSVIFSEETLFFSPRNQYQERRQPNFSEGTWPVSKRFGS
jgi:hypothetical protein